MEAECTVLREHSCVISRGGDYDRALAGVAWPGLARPRRNNLLLTSHLLPLDCPPSTIAVWWRIISWVLRRHFVGILWTLCGLFVSTLWSFCGRLFVRSGQNFPLERFLVPLLCARRCMRWCASRDEQSQPSHASYSRDMSRVMARPARRARPF